MPSTEGKKTFADIGWTENFLQLTLEVIPFLEKLRRKRWKESRKQLLVLSFPVQPYYHEVKSLKEDTPHQFLWTRNLGMVEWHCPVESQGYIVGVWCAHTHQVLALQRLGHEDGAFKISRGSILRSFLQNNKSWQPFRETYLRKEGSALRLTGLLAEHSSWWAQGSRSLPDFMCPTAFTFFSLIPHRHIQGI